MRFSLLNIACIKLFSFVKIIHTFFFIQVIQWDKGLKRITMKYLRGKVPANSIRTFKGIFMFLTPMLYI